MTLKADNPRTTPRLVVILAVIGINAAACIFCTQLSPPSHAQTQPIFPTAPTTPAAPCGLTWQAPIHPVQVVRPFDPPEHQWAQGHRGVDLALPTKTPIHAPASAVVRFAGSVAAVPVVSLQHCTETTAVNAAQTPQTSSTALFVSSYQPVTAVVTAGQHVTAGQVIGTLAHQPPPAHCHQHPCLHWSAFTLEPATDDAPAQRTYTNPLQHVHGSKTAPDSPGETASTTAKASGNDLPTTGTNGGHRTNPSPQTQSAPDAPTETASQGVQPATPRGASDGAPPSRSTPPAVPSLRQTTSAPLSNSSAPQATTEPTQRLPSGRKRSGGKRSASSPPAQHKPVNPTQHTNVMLASSAPAQLPSLPSSRQEVTVLTSSSSLTRWHLVAVVTTCLGLGSLMAWGRHRARQQLSAPPTDITQEPRLFH